MRGKYVRRGVQVRGGLAAHPAQLVPQRDGPVMTRRYWQAHITCSRALMLYQCDVRFRCVRQTCEQRALLTHQPISPPSSSHQPSSHHPIIPSSHHPIIPSSHQPINPSTHHPYTCKGKCAASTMSTIKLTCMLHLLLLRRRHIDDVGPLTDQSPTGDGMG